MNKVSANKSDSFLQKVKKTEIITCNVSAWVSINFYF